MRWKAAQWLPLGEEVFATASDIVTYSGHYWSLSLIRTNDNTWIVESPLQSTGPNHGLYFWRLGSSRQVCALQLGESRP